MAADEKPEWMELCARVAKEEDPIKLRDVIAELSRLLDAEEQRRKNKSLVQQHTPRVETKTPDS